VFSSAHRLFAMSRASRFFRALAALLLPAAFALPAHAFDWTAWWPTAGSGHVVSQVYEVPAFDGLQLATRAEVVLRPGAHRTVTIEADDNLMPHFDVYVVQRSLVVQDKHAFRATRARLVITTPGLVGIATGGETQVHGSGLAARQMRLSASGSSRIALDHLACEALRVEAGEQAQLQLDGAANELSAALAGRSVLAADRLLVRRAQLGGADASQARVSVVERLSATVSDRASVRYYGSPQVFAQPAGLASVQALPAPPSAPAR
jgi:hypothetical protein